MSRSVALQWTCRGLRSLALAILAVVVFFFLLFPCPPWTLKMVIAQRAGCMNNLKVILETLHNRGIPLDVIHPAQVRAVIDDLDLSCPEGSEIRGRRSGYTFVGDAGSGMITEEAGNHPARSHFLGGTLAEERFAIDAAGRIRR